MIVKLHNGVFMQADVRNKLESLKSEKENYIKYRNLLDSTFTEAIKKIQKSLKESGDHFSNVWIDGKSFKEDEFSVLYEEIAAVQALLYTCMQSADERIGYLKSTIEYIEKNKFKNVGDNYGGL